MGRECWAMTADPCTDDGRSKGGAGSRNAKSVQANKLSHAEEAVDRI